MTKKIICILAAAAFVFLAGCGAGGGETTKANATKSPVSTTATPVELKMKAQYIRTDADPDKINGLPSVYAIRSKAEVDNYIKANKAKFYGKLGRNPDPASDETIGFLDAVDQYDAEYFKKNLLIFVVLVEPSGSIRHKAVKFEQTEDGSVLTVNRLLPKVQTADIAYWHIIVELSKEEYNNKAVTVKFKDIKL
ncbi:MAG TPA: hypothetical protein PLD68_01320 [Clostridiales bacterium]|nr:MAG: hypothetical protein BWY37_00751 [Firmicutes bacterium ADurb.Bin262]HOU09327.1 hypothetical protein [Clostridiales bacterium]HQH63273.1 hypothetical protein [Clostridiales bacterium]